MAALPLAYKPQCVISWDTLKTRKPDPEPLLHACKLIDCLPHDTIYIGDAERDIQAGNNAQMQTLVALFGYIGEDDNPSLWGATDSVEQPADIIQWIKQNRALA
jgi:phosphoglycolate phosphatase